MESLRHSFGTLCLGRALQRNPSLRLARICLFGAILPPTFPWSTIRQRAQYESVLNETCTDDPWPRRADRYLFWTGAGPSGCDGFLEGEPSVHNCPYDWTGHSGLASRPALYTHLASLFARRPPASRLSTVETPCPQQSQHASRHKRQLTTFPRQRQRVFRRRHFPTRLDELRKFVVRLLGTAETAASNHCASPSTNVLGCDPDAWYLTTTKL